MPRLNAAFLEASVASVASEVERVVQALRVGSIREEEDFTSQMLAAVRIGLVRTRLNGLGWNSIVLKKQTEEPHVGADFAGVLRIRTDDYNVDKVFLAQAKLAGPRKRIVKAKLVAQVEAMLAITPMAYVFLYRPNGVFVVSAAAVAAAAGDVSDLREWRVADFFEEHFGCFIGDPALAPVSSTPLDAWTAELPARLVLVAEASAEYESVHVG